MNVKPNANFSPVNHKQIGSNRLQRARATPGLVVPPESKIKYLVATAAGAMIANALFTADGVLEITKVSVFTVISSGIIVGSAIMLLSGERRIVRIASGICGGGLLALIGSIQGVLASTFGLFFFRNWSDKNCFDV